MDTKEHTELGNALKFNGFKNNPYLKTGKQGELSLQMMRFSDRGIPEPMNLNLSFGNVIAMAGDFFTDPTWSMALNLPKCHGQKAKSVGKKLIRQPVRPEDKEALLRAYNNLASPDVQNSDIDKIYRIDNTRYVSFSDTLNDYVKQLMFYLRVKDYGEMLNRNQTHFTPWSVRVYTIGHHLALEFSRIAYEFQQLAARQDYIPKQESARLLWETLKAEKTYTADELNDLACRYQAMGLGLELFTFHYYSDHFAAGHMSMVSDLRVLLQERFGVWGSILANDLHNELNRVGVYTTRAYDPTPMPSEAPNAARGDSDFDECINYFNKVACLSGMQKSLGDLERVSQGGELPTQENYAGLEDLPDVDKTYRQPQPLFILDANERIFYRNDLNQIRLLSPSDYQQLRENPGAHGYSQLTSSWGAFKLAAKLRLFPYLYHGQLQPLAPLDLLRIENEEQALNPERQPIPVPPCSTPALQSNLSWRTPVNGEALQQALLRHGLLAKAVPHHEKEASHEPIMVMEL
ncbi:type IV secretion protein Dot [Legionella taurinensis]|uniref:Type IV secretion protein Dot n=1 Tax=Legionella taurinensis TaxID=70611 RepID=A0A3A5LDR7_9GAMM|nr:type IV secretion protein Dot [Legionella taurinensis]MDX1836218.1 type IV secretion protein Dot [Legionella taurinensis]PUT42021.1 type IV secretion protein Dot [Legionella taurinensis]PUT44808.1 type IV secretion protein Dot [Legionella taurinensis]PUT48129.1 type IV secretion protein Dot [Legionella taurinensis]PUT48943.1 type IV secretion protein Dot [Legionella taurinensis]